MSDDPDGVQASRALALRIIAVLRATFPDQPTALMLRASVRVTVYLASASAVPGREPQLMDEIAKAFTVVSANMRTERGQCAPAGTVLQ
jgi:hypothetical protein